MRASPRRWAYAVALLGLSACTDGQLARAPTATLMLSGEWTLDAGQSDDVLKTIKDAIPVPKKQFDNPNNSDGWGSDSPTQTNRNGRGGGRGGRGNNDSAGGSSPTAYEPLPPAYGKLKPVDFVKAFVWPATRLEIKTSADQIWIKNDSRERSFLPGDDQPYSVSDRYGSRTVTAGYSGQTMIVRSQDGQRFSVEERFERNQEFLIESIKFQARGIKSIKVQFKYRKATANDALGQSDGPPIPGAR